MADSRLWFTRDNQKLTEGITLRNDKALPGGWSTYEVWHTRPALFPGAIDEEKIADIYCGKPINLIAGYGFVYEDDPVQDVR